MAKDRTEQVKEIVRNTSDGLDRANQNKQDDPGDAVVKQVRQHQPDRKPGTNKIFMNS